MKKTALLISFIVFMGSTSYSYADEYSAYQGGTTTIINKDNSVVTTDYTGKVISSGSWEQQGNEVIIYQTPIYTNEPRTEESFYKSDIFQ